MFIILNATNFIIVCLKLMTMMMEALIKAAYLCENALQQKTRKHS